MVSLLDKNVVNKVMDTIMNFEEMSSISLRKSRIKINYTFRRTSLKNPRWFHIKFEESTNSIILTPTKELSEVCNKTAIPWWNILINKIMIDLVGGVSYKNYMFTAKALYDTRSIQLFFSGASFRELKATLESGEDLVLDCSISLRGGICE